MWGGWVCKVLSMSYPIFVMLSWVVVGLGVCQKLVNFHDLLFRNSSMQWKTLRKRIYIKVFKINQFYYLIFNADCSFMMESTFYFFLFILTPVCQAFQINIKPKGRGAPHKSIDLFDLKCLIMHTALYCPMTFTSLS